jgi:hypothetical protein
MAQVAVARLPGDRRIIDLPSSSAGLTAALRDLGFSETFGMARMYRGTPLRVSPNLQATAPIELG